MLEKDKIKTYNPEKFLDRYMPPKDNSDTLLKSEFGKFFIVKVEDMIKLIKLPVPPVRSTNHSCIYLTHGEAQMTIGSNDYTIYKNEILIVPAGQVFSFRYLDINNGYLFNFHNDFFTEKFGTHNLLESFDFLKVWGNHSIKLNAQISEFVLNIFKRIYFEYSQNGIKNSDIIQSYLISLLCEINASYKPFLDNKQNSALDITKKFKELLFTHFRTKSLVSDYASLMHVSPNHLNKCVKAITDKSPTKWIDEAIILEAKVLLHQSDLSISQIASQLGYYEQSYFSRLFKKYEHITPTQFRKRIEKS